MSFLGDGDERAQVLELHAVSTRQIHIERDANLYPIGVAEQAGPRLDFPDDLDHPGERKS
jgi:hypothetical protein